MMDLMMTPYKMHLTLLKEAGIKKEATCPGVENMLFIQSKKRKFLELLATQRTKNKPIQFPHIDLSYVDLSNIDLTGVDLTGANLTNANLSGAKLNGANLTNAKLIRTILTNANLTDVVLINIVADRITLLALRQAFNQQWLEAAQKSIHDFTHKWERLKSVDGFYTFEAMLKRINEWNRKNGVTIAEIVEVIEAVIQSLDIRRLIFQIIQGVDVNCYAHLLTVFNNAQCLAKLAPLFDSHAEKEILSLAKGMVKQHLIEEATLPVMRNQWNEGRCQCNSQGTGPDVNEAWNIQIALRHQLAIQLALPVPLKTPENVIDVVELTHSDKEFVVNFINHFMNNTEQLVEALVALPMWQIYLKRILNEQIISSSISEEALFRQQTEKILRLQSS